MKQLLEESKQQLLNPLGNARRKLLIILNIVYITLVPVFLISEKIATGNFVNDSLLYLVYGSAVFFNIISAVYNIKIFKNLNNRNQRKFDLLFGYVSVIPILVMSFCNLMGLGNPSNDAILTDFAMAQSLMIVTVMIIGRKAVVVWFIIVVLVLFWNVSSRGWDYEYHYSTPSEVIEYKQALERNEFWALQRKAELEKAGLNPPKITRYFNVWIVFIIVAFLVAYFFSGITIDILKIIPSVVSNIEQALEGSKRMELKQKADEEKTTTFINLAHETKTPLTLINNYLDEYIKKYGKNSEMEIIKWNVQRLTTDIVNFFDIERFNKGFSYDHNQVSSFSSILANKLFLFENLAKKKNIEIQSNIENDCYILANPGAIERIINNLIENALKFTPENGKVKVSLLSQGNRLRFSVSDTGIGIRSDLHSKVFEPYFQLGENRKFNEGMGMGLAIVKNIVDDINGKLELQSELTQGTEVTALLPRYTLKEGETSISHEVSNSFSLHFPSTAIADVANNNYQPFILLVEDNISMLNYLVESLKGKYNVYVAQNGEEALKKLKSIVKLDLIISDMMMDGIDGFDLCRAILRNEDYEHIPFVFLTAKATAKDKLKGLELGAIDYIEKPFSVPQLISKIDSVLEMLKKQRNSIEALFKSNHSTNNPTGPQFVANCKEYQLTKREVDVAKLAIIGQTEEQIAQLLFISDGTVSAHKTNIYKKTGVSNIAELIIKLCF